MTDPLIIETPLNDKVAYGFEAGPQFNNVRSRLKTTGKERVRICWDQPLRRFRSLHRRFSPTLYKELLSAFMVAHGDAYAFLMRDWTDYKATNELLTATPADSDPVQLTVAYTFGSQSKLRKILRPSADTVTVQERVAGVWTDKPGTVSLVGGTFAPTAPWTPGAEIRWSGEFYVIVKFEEDYMPATYEDFLAITTPLALVEYLPSDYTP